MSVVAAASSEFRGNDRFTVIRQLGSGGMGDVYEVFDGNRGAHVALKTLRRTGPDNAHWLKREFRALADVVHPNLVGLHELISDGEHSFFTMDIVHGTNFLDYFTGSPATSPLQSLVGINDSSSWTSAADQPEDAHRIAFHAEYEGPLREALGQLALGVQALHEAGKLHRDLKPSNVFVAGGPRVVILDFGLVEDESTGEDDRDSISGTPAYMAPEQMRGERASPASDWYAVGVVLYEVLVGRLPFAGRPLEVLRAKQFRVPDRPSAANPHVPPDLEALCLELLQPRPEQRPSGREIVARLSMGQKAESGPPSFGSPRPFERLFVGRRTEQESLFAAFSSARAGSPIVAYVHGAPGIGKSTLVEHFLGRLRRESLACVFEGRCHERESIPFKAFDRIIDALTLYLCGLNSSDALALVPHDVHALLQAFPMLSRVEFLRDALKRSPDSQDPSETRRRAFAAFKELLRGLATRLTVVFHIDDIQWSDADSAHLLRELLDPEGAPSLLVVVTSRSDSTESPIARILADEKVARVVREIQVLPLDAEESTNLALGMLGGERGDAFADALAIEARGNPLLLGELAQYGAARTRELAPDGTVSLATVVRARLLDLPAEARRLLEVVALSGRAVRLGAALTAAHLEPSTQKPVLTLQQANLVRSVRVRGVHCLTTYHDRIRETVVAELGRDALVEHHAGLAAALEAHGDTDYEAIGKHYELGGDGRRALSYAVRAADTARAALAFAQSARLYRWALELRPGDPEQVRTLHVDLGDALAKAGRGAEAAEAFLVGARGGSNAEVLDLRRRAAEQWLITGHIDRGFVALEDVLQAVRLELPRNTAFAIGELLVTRARLKARGLTPGVSRVTTPDTLLRIDTCRIAAWPLSMLDLASSAALDARHALLALDAGEPARLAVALASHATFVSTGGVKTRVATDRLLGRAGQLARELNQPYVTAVVTLLTATCYSHFFEWQRALPLLEEAERMLSEQCTGVTWELDFARAMYCRTLSEVGRWKEHGARLKMWLSDARDRGDRYLTANLHAFHGYYASLAQDDPQKARVELTGALLDWPCRGFNAQRLAALVGHVHIAIYSGENARAHGIAQSLDHDFSRSLLLGHQVSRVMAKYASGCAALALARDERQRRALLKIVDRKARQLSEERTGYADPAALSLQAGAAFVRGDSAASIRGLRRAAEGFRSSGRAAHAAAAERKLGLILRGDEGARLVERADEALKSEGVVHPARMATTLVPAGPDS